MDVITILTDNPEVAILLAIVMRLGLAYQRDLTYSEFRTIHALKRGLFPLLDRYTPNGVRLINVKGYRDHPEYIGHVDASMRTVTKLLRKEGGSFHTICSIKRRHTPEGDQYSAVHLVWTHSDGNQTEAFLFPSVEGSGVDVYAHFEPSVNDPVGHLTEPQTDGDPNGVITPAIPG
jgi:hypothetical protein